MTIEGLNTVRQPVDLDLSDHVGASVEALRMLGLVEDQDRVAETLAVDYAKLVRNSGRTGELFIQLPKGMITLADLIQISDSVPPPKDKRYPKTSFYNELWTPGFSQGGYQADELDNLALGSNDDFTSHARLAIHDPVGELEPLLHFLDQPFDKIHAKRGKQTQLEAVHEAIDVYQTEEHEDFTMAPLNVKAVAFIALSRRIKGEAMPMAGSYMRDATLPRKIVEGKSLVGYVSSLNDKIYLHKSFGRADSRFGVGLSVGPKELKV